MIKTILFLFLPLTIYAQQDLRCVSEGNYGYITATGIEKQIRKPITICYYGDYFSFTTPELGLKSFKITSRTRSVDAEGYVIESFINAETEDKAEGWYNIQIYYKKTKIIVIQIPTSGNAFVIRSKKFIGSQDNTLIGTSSPKKN